MQEKSLARHSLLSMLWRTWSWDKSPSLLVRAVACSESGFPELLHGSAQRDVGEIASCLLTRAVLLRLCW